MSTNLPRAPRTTNHPMPHNILSIETATSVCSVALRTKGSAPEELRQNGTGIHSEMVFVFADELLRKKGLKLTELDAIILSAGPGSYTGLRVGSSAVKGMIFGSEVSFYATDTLAGIALGAAKKCPEAGRIHAVLDARRKHLYHQAFRLEDNRHPIAEGGNSIKPLTDFDSIVHKEDVIAGTGTDRLPDDLAKVATILGEEIISALNLIELFDLWSDQKAGFPASHIKKVAPERFEPYY